MIEIQFLQQGHPTKAWWEGLVRLYARPGLEAALHCWKEEDTACRLAAAIFPEKENASWPYGRIFSGVLDEKTIEAILAPAPGEEGPTPFFTVTMGTSLSSEHWGTELYLEPPMGNEAALWDWIEKVRSVAKVGEV